MSWNNGGGPPSPWGPPGGRPPPRPERGPDKGGPERGGNRGPWSGNGGRGTGGSLPDLDELIARMQDKARRFVPGGGGPGGGGPFGFGFGRGQGRLLALAGIVALAAWVGSGFYRVQPDEQGVVLRFGAYDGRTTAPGLNYHLPWPIETAMTPSVTTTNSVEIGFRGPSGDRAAARSVQDLATREVPEEALMLTGDENIIDINFSVFWRIRTVGDYLFNARDPSSTVRAAAESTMRQVVGRTPIQPALAEARARIEADVAAGTQAILDQYRAGVEITQVQLQRVDPPAAVIDSFRDVQRAITEAEQARNEAESYRNGIIPRARGDAARLTAEAEGDRLAGIAEATGQAQRFQSVYAAYAVAKDVTLRRLYIETMQEVLQHTPVTVVDDQLRGVVPFLQLDPGKTVAAVPPGGATR